ncbi:MAG: 4-hydroxyphenylacetate 3-hydroxylase N-terminal domain-containing protein [Dehalococcoidia bacterium]
MGLRTGDDYLAGLKDNREIWYGGRRIADVTAEPGFRNMARTVAQYYDLQNLPHLRDQLTYETPDGDRAHLSFIEPRSKEDLRRRAGAFAAWSEVTCGLMGRSPDYMNACMMAVGAAKHFWGSQDAELGQHAYDLYLRCRRNDVTMTHTFINPMVDRFKPLAEQEPYINAGVVERTSDGIIVRGARNVATLAPFCDGNLSFFSPRLADPEEDIYALGFVAPVGSPGLKWICRDTVDLERSHFDQPLSYRFEEMDCIAVFEDVFVPWENVFIYKDIDIHNRGFQGMHFMEALGHHILVKNLVKTRFLFGLAHLLAETIQVDKFINVQDRLGDILMWLQTMESMAIAAVEGAEKDPHNGLYYANAATTVAALRLYPEIYPRIIDHIYQLGGGGYVAVPQEATLELAELAIDKYFQGASRDGKGRVQLFRLAWDLIGSGWGGRQELYERFFFGDTQRMKALNYVFYDKEEAVAMVQRMLQPPRAGEPLPLPDHLRADGPEVAAGRER